MKLGVVAPLCMALAATIHAAAAQDRSPTEFRQTGALVPAHITESSGVAVSRRFPGVLWTHNDSGDGPFLYAVDSTGALLAKIRVTGAAAVDWEDIALGPCPSAMASPCLFVGDIGDNGEDRAHVEIYVVPEPDPRAGRALSVTAPAHRLQVRYADGPHDAEALAVGPDDRGTIITKGRSGPILRYAIAPTAFLEDSITVAPAETLAIVPERMLGRWVTGAAIAPSGRVAAVRTYTEMFFFAVPATQNAHWRLSGTPCWLGLKESQGEGVDFLDARRLVLTSEAGLGGDGAIHVLQC